MANRLSREKSPYLRQHAKNPVDWYPWGEEAFRRAKRENKPIFLSIGYSTCHWCHVMERESFADPEVASLLNETFVCVKVDREERPDIDAVFMQYCLALRGSGGWPLTVLLTPEGKPFFAATYLPKHSRGAVTGLVELTKEVKELWQKEEKEVREQAEQMAKALEKLAQSSPGPSLSTPLLDQATQQLRHSYDAFFGGFGAAPKFPTPHILIFLLRRFAATGNTTCRDMALHTLRCMRYGGIFDQLGFGFHRYSTDRQWKLPHFEKMLYDQALLLLAYTEAFQLTRDPFFQRVAHEIVTYVFSELSSSEGGFYSAQDADSEGEEGKYYLWEEEELRRYLPAQVTEWLLPFWGVQKEGNYLEEATGRRTGRNVLHMTSSWEKLAEKLGLSEEELHTTLDEVIQTLLEVRKRRTPPAKDTKILTDWNALMIAALARAGTALGRESYLERAEKAWAFLEENLLEGNRLYHRYFQGERGIPAFLDDYSFSIFALLELYQGTWNLDYLEKAYFLTHRTFELFWDFKEKGFFFSSSHSNTPLVRPKELFEGAMPSGNSMMLFNLRRLFSWTKDSVFEKYSEELERAFSERVSSYPAGYPFFLLGVEWKEEGKELLLFGEREDPEIRFCLAWLKRQYCPHLAPLALFESSPKDFLFFPFPTKAPTFLLCTSKECLLPTHRAEEVIELLHSLREKNKEAASGSPEDKGEGEPIPPKHGNHS